MREINSEENPKQRFLKFLLGLYAADLVEEEYPRVIVSEINDVLREGQLTGIDVLINKPGDSLNRETIPLEKLSDRLLRQDLRKLINDVERTMV